MTQLKEFEFYLSEYEKPFLGFDFSYVERTGRMVTEPMKWSYTSILLPYLRSVETMLDMGTGGGEYLELLSPLPPITYATEQYDPNIPIASKRLKKYNVNVVKPVNDSNLPFNSNYFDLIINKHESYNAGEVNRILNDEAYFITQQVGEKNFFDMNELFSYQDPDNDPWNVEFAIEELEKNGFKVQYSNQEFPKTRFYDLGAVLFYLKAIPWQIKDFTINKYRKTLNFINKNIKKAGYIEFTEHRFILKAQKQYSKVYRQ